MNASLIEMAAARLVQKLGGQWRARGAMCRCPAHNDRIPSLSVRAGESSILFKCFAGCETSDVLRAIRRLNLDVPPADLAGVDPSYRRTHVPTGQLARQLWASGSGLKGTVAENYLRGRGIDILPQGLRWHPRTPLRVGAVLCFRPALLAAVEEGGRIVSVQRLFLDGGRGELARDLVPPKRSLGRPSSGAVRLWNAGPRLGLAEGVESAASAAILLGFPVWAVLGAERLHQITIPDMVETLILLPDNDLAGRRAARRAHDIYRQSVLHVETIWPWWGLNDWNDVLRQEKQGGSWSNGR